MYPASIQRLVTELSKLPGIGGRTAQRLAFHLLRASPEDALALADAIREVKERIGLCEVCFNLAEGPLCAICADTRRDMHLICVVEEPGDVIPIERTSEYRGRYHVLGGALSPIDGVEPEDLKIAELLRRAAAAEGLDTSTLAVGDQLARALMGAGESLAVWWGEHPEEPVERVALVLMNFAWNGLGGLVDGRTWTPDP